MGSWNGDWRRVGMLAGSDVFMKSLNTEVEPYDVIFFQPTWCLFNLTW